MKTILLTIISSLWIISSVYAGEFRCKPGNVACLINSINEANVSNEEDTIFLKGNYRLFSELPPITGTIVIKGDGKATLLYHEASQFSFHFLVGDGGNLTVDGLTLKGRAAVSEMGGGIFNSEGGQLTILNSIIKENFHFTVGGVYNSGSLSIINSSVDGNVSFGGLVGGIFNGGAMLIENSSIINNSISAPDPSSGGASAIFNDGNILISNSTVARNTVFNSDGPFTPGAVLNLFFAQMTAINTTIAGNETFRNSVGSGAGGIVTFNRDLVHLANTIIARNSPGDCEGGFTSLGHNFLEEVSIFCAESLSGSDLTGDAGLGDFIDGYFPLLLHSLAIDAADAASCTPTDQLGKERVDGDKNGVVVCDIGAIEYTPTLRVRRK